MKFSEALKLMEKGKICEDLKGNFYRLIDKKLMYNSSYRLSLVHDDKCWIECQWTIHELLVMHWEPQEKPKPIKKYYKHLYIGDDYAVHETNWVEYKNFSDVNDNELLDTIETTEDLIIEQFKNQVKG